MSNQLRRRVATLFALGTTISLLVAIAGSTQAQGQGWSEPISLSDNFAQSYLPDIATDIAGNLYVVWDVVFEKRSSGWGDGVAFSMWDGKTWSTAVDIFGQEMSHLPTIAVDSKGRVHVIAVGYYADGHSELGYSRAWAQERPMDAHSWAEPVDLSGGYPRVYWHDIIVDSHDWIHVVFSDQFPTQDREIVGGQCVGEDCSWVFYTRSTDGGDSWSTPVKISPAMATGARAVITSDNKDRLYVAWCSEAWIHRAAGNVPSAMGFTYSLDGGSTWSRPETQLLDTGTCVGDEPCFDYRPSIAVDSQGTILVVTMVQGENRPYLYRRGLNYPWVEGVLPRIRAPDFGPGYGFHALAVDSSDNFHFLYPVYALEGSPEAPGLLHAMWNRDQGWSNWTRAVSSPLGSGCGLGDLVISRGNQLNVVWFDTLGSSGVIFAEPRGTFNVHYASLQTGSRPIPVVPLPQIPTPTAATPTPRSTPTPSTPMTPQATMPSKVLPRRDIELPAPESAGLIWGTGVAILALIALVVVARARIRK
jgi:hypothetical protein